MWVGNISLLKELKRSKDGLEFYKRLTPNGVKPGFQAQAPSDWIRIITKLPLDFRTFEAKLLGVKPH